MRSRLARVGGRKSSFHKHVALRVSAMNGAIHTEDKTVATWSTIAFVDVVESVLHAQRNETRWIRRLRGFVAQATECVLRSGGRVVERAGDGLVLRFDSPHQAIACVLELHAAVSQAPGEPGEEPLQLRAGLHHAQIWYDESGIYGWGVNLAARVAAMGGAGDTIVTAPVRDGLVAHIDADVIDLGECHLKHVDEPLRLFKVRRASPALPASLRDSIAQRLKTRPTLAVMPFRSVLTQGEGPVGPLNSADVLHDQLVRRLSGLPVVHVISGPSTRAWRGREVDPAQVYRSLGADYLLRGSVTGSEEFSTASRSLELDVSLWKRGVDEPISRCSHKVSVLDALSSGSDLFSRIVEDIGGRIVAVEQRVAARASALPNMASHTLYLQAVAALHRFSRDDFDRARQMLEALTERAPRHPDPLAWLARWHVFNVVQGWSADRERDGQLALEFSGRALDRDPESSLALTMSGSVMAGIRRDPDEANRLYDQALVHNPNESLAWLMKGVAHGFLDQGDAAIRSSELAMGLSPLDPVYDFYCSLSASASLAAGELHRAVTLAELAIQKNRAHGSSYRTLCIAAYLQGEQDKARGAINELLCVEPQASVALFRARAPGNHPQHDAFAEALRQSGLPET